MDKGSGSGIFQDPDPGDPKRPDPDPQHCNARNPYFFDFFLLTGGSPTPLPFTDMSVECRFITPSLTQYVDEPDAVAPS